MPRLLRLMQVERIRLLTLSGELDGALATMRGLGLWPVDDLLDTSEDWALRHSTTIIAVVRWLVLANRPRDALALLDPAQDYFIRGGQLLALAKLRAVRAAALWRRRERIQAVRSLLSAIRLLGDQPFRRFIIDEGETIRAVVQAALDADPGETGMDRKMRRRLSTINVNWARRFAISGSAAGRHSGPEPEDHGHSDQHRRYVELLSGGHSNKEIARLMGVSVNTVKYHLKALYRDLGVDNRIRAVQAAREIGLLD